MNKSGQWSRFTKSLKCFNCNQLLEQVVDNVKCHFMSHCNHVLKQYLNANIFFSKSIFTHLNSLTSKLTKITIAKIELLCDHIYHC